MVLTERIWKDADAATQKQNDGRNHYMGAVRSDNAGSECDEKTQPYNETHMKYVDIVDAKKKANQPQEDNWLQYRGPDVKKVKCFNCGYMMSVQSPCCWSCDAGKMDDKNFF